MCAWGTTEDSAAVVFESVPLAGDVVAGVYAATSSVLDVLQSWLTRDGAGVLVVMTRGAVALPGEDVTDLAGAAVWGLVRSAQTEHPGRIVLVDSDAPLDDSALAAVVTTGEPQVLWRRGEVYTARVHGSRAVGGLLVPPSDRPWRLAMSTAGTFENLRLELIPDADAPLGPGQVRVAVSAIAANFRDVMIALGLYPDPDAVMGVEACGVVIETSLNKGSFAVGDRVMGLFPEGTGTVASTDQRLLVKVPAGWSHTAAATTSVVFATAHYALVDLAAARSGQRVLIHAGTGGVGMAAVQLARHLGLEVFATASKGKWDARRAPGPADPAVAEQPATVAAGPAGSTGPTGATIAAVADQARGTTGAAGHPGGRLGEAVAAVAVQNPTITAVGAGRCSIRAIADQGTPEQRLGGRIDHGQQILFQRLRRSVGRLGARIGATGGVQRLHEAVMKCRGLSVQRLIVRGVITEQPCDSLRYLVGSGRQHRGRGRRCRRVCRTQRCADIRDILRRRRQHLWSCRDKRHQPPSQPVM